MATTRRIVLLGAPGAGKGTQARRLSDSYGVPQISTGDIFRGHVENKTKIGLRIEAYLNEGQLVPDSLVCEIVAARLAEEDCAGGYILDGFPRSVPQAENLESLLSGRGEAIDVAIVLDVPDDELVGRLTARRTCPACGRIYNLESDPPKREGRCDNEGCGDTELQQREDDKEETIRARLDVYHNTTEPIVAYYKNKGLCRPVGGTALSPDEIADQIAGVLEKSGVGAPQ